MAYGRRPGPIGTGDDELVVRHGQGSPKAGFSAVGPVGGVIWHQALKVAKATPASSFEGRESIGSLKQRASAAIPLIGARIQAWNQGSGAPAYWAGTLAFGENANARNTIYTSTWHQLEPDRGRYWFEAAGMVTGRRGVKDMEGALAEKTSALARRLQIIPEGSPRSEEMRFIVAGNAFLYPYNLHNFYVLREKRDVPGFERLRGEDLDRGLVVLEQTLVQQFVDTYGWPSALDKETSLRRLSEGFLLASDFVRSAVATLGKRFDFGSLDDRIRLGIALVAKLRWLG
jgi:hypothetical protein